MKLRLYDSSHVYFQLDDVRCTDQPIFYNANNFVIKNISSQFRI